jgi:hypothetical protein
MLNLFKRRLLITDEDIKKIRGASWEDCAKWYDLLNSWNWPTELLPEEVPPKKWSPFSRRSQLMGKITEKVGEKYLLMKYNTVGSKGDMTQEEFEDFWDYTTKGDAEAYKKYSERVHKKHNKE